MANNKFEIKDFEIDNGWCPGCGNFSILNVLKSTLDELGILPQQAVISSGIGQAAKMPQYININYFNGLHGRALPVATAIKASNPQLLVIAEGGDGDMYGEGGNHFMHTVRRNVDIVHLVHNNMVYGLTKGQASPTSQRGFVTPLQIYGVNNEPANPLAVALSYGATFIARAYSGDRKELNTILKAAIHHKGYALIDIFHPCVTFNKVNNHKWFKDNTYYVDETYNPKDFSQALQKVYEYGKFPLGIIYQKTDTQTFNDTLPAYQTTKEPLYMRRPDTVKIQELVNSF
ncbi:MAG: thiamine pyrophosphate-dependent enzyme [Bacteroidales bacterium]